MVLGLIISKKIKVLHRDNYISPGNLVILNTVARLELNKKGLWAVQNRFSSEQYALVLFFCVCSVSLFFHLEVNLIVNQRWMQAIEVSMLD